MSEALFQYFVVAGGEIVAQVDTLVEADRELRLKGPPDGFVLECVANVERPVGAMG